MSARMARREFLLASGTALAATALAACAPKAAPTQPAPTKAAQQEPTKPTEPTKVPATLAPAKEVTITFMGWGGTEEDEGIRAAIDKFQKENPGIKVTWLHTPENYEEKLLASIAAGTPPDTGFIPDTLYLTFVRDNILLDITDMLESDPVLGAKDYFVQPLESMRSAVNGRWYGIGSTFVSPHVYYNADVFEEAGIAPPSNDPDQAWDWDQFLDVARALTVDSNGRHPGENGFDASSIQRWGVHYPTWWWPPMCEVFSNGGTVVDPDTLLIRLDEPEAVEAIQRIADLVNVHHVAPSASVFGDMGMTNTQMLENAKLAMAVDGSWALAWMHKIQAKLGTAVLPKMKEPATLVGGHFHGILSATKEPQASWQWLRMLASPWYQAYFDRIGLWLPNQTSLLTEEGLKSWMTPEVHPAGYELIVTEYVPKYGHWILLPPGWSKALAVWSAALDPVWTGDATAEQVLKQAVPEANSILKQEAER